MTSSATALAQDGGEDRLDHIFQALANRTRRAMLRRLAEGPAKVTEIAEPFQMSLPSASKNLRVLENAGLIERRIVGRVHHCRLAPGALRDAGEWLAYYQNFWTGTLDAIARYVESEDEDRPGATKS